MFIKRFDEDNYDEDKITLGITYAKSVDRSSYSVVNDTSAPL